MTGEQAKELLKQNQFLVEKLANASEKKKDGWDKLSSVATALIGPLISFVIALVGLHFTSVYNERQFEFNKNASDSQLRLAAANTVSPFMPYITGKDEKAKTYAVLVISRFDAQLGVQLAQAYQSGPGLAAIANTGGSSAQNLVFNALRASPNIPKVGGSAPSTEKGVGSRPKEGDLLPKGIAVSLGEVVTVQGTSKGAPSVCQFSPLQRGQWTTDSTPVGQQYLEFKGHFTLVGPDAFDVLCSFSDVATETSEYDLTITGTNGHWQFTDALHPSVPVVRYAFTVIGQ